MRLVNSKKDCLLVIFEGVDGSGKTTQIELAKQALQESNIIVQTTRNLGGSVIGEELRKAILSPAPRPPLTDLYIGAAIQEALAEELDNYRKQCQVILMDRGPISLAAYNLETDKLAWQFADLGIKKFKPDLIIYYDLPLEKAKQRLALRAEAKNYFEDKPIDYLKSVSKNLLAGADKYKAVIIDADQSIETVHKRTVELITTLL
ncbi:MAG TPA: dTMP kinase [Candidatus Saccharimonadales bacterium]|nr:dTMP kinase [Candidatus Saccharimonadales bacterium]